MKRLRGALVAGLLILVPAIATIDILAWLVRSVENMVRNVLPTSLLPFDFHGLGLLTALVLILLVGIAAQNYAGKWLVRQLNQGIRRMPVVGGIYGAIQKFLETIFNGRQEQFNGVVLVPFPRQGIYSVGFRTGKPDPNLVKGLPATGDRVVNVFVPCTPNPTSGFYLLVPEKDLVPVDLPVPEAFKIVISMGMVTSDDGEAP